MDLPLLGHFARRRYQPWECYPFWERHCPGFSRPCRDLLASDVTPRSRAAVRAAAQSLLTPKRHRLLAKFTGWPRIGLLHEIFPDARFVHIVRDGRAVVSSLLASDFWDGWRGPPVWRCGTLDPEEQEIWEQSGRSFVALAAIEWNKLLAAMDAARASVPQASFLEVSYEEFCRDQLTVIRQVTQFCNLPCTPSFEKSVRQSRIDSQNWKWRADLTPDQQAMVYRVIGRQLQRRGYTTNATPPSVADRMRVSVYSVAEVCGGGGAK